MTRGASESREPSLGLLDRWKRRIGKILNLSSRPEAGNPSRPDPPPERTLSVSSRPIRSPAEAPPAPHLGKEASLLPGHTQIYETFRKKIVDMGFVLRGVEEAMLTLCESYRKSVPPTRLQPYPWGFPKLPRPYVVYWVRLYRKKEEACDESLQIKASKRPRWFKYLKIRSRRDLHTAIHWNGLDAHRKTVLQYHDAASSLNKAHHNLALRALALVKTFKRNSGGVRTVQGYASMTLEDPAYDLLNRTGLQLLECAWRMQWVVEKEFARLNELLSQGGFPTVRLTMAERRGGGAFVGFVWEDAKTPLALASFERGHGLSPGTDSAAHERNELVKSLDARMEVVRVVLSRLEEMAATAERDLEVWKAESPSLIQSGRSVFF
jgi:hypothetical protein